jgi:hypothetical protein
MKRKNKILLQMFDIKPVNETGDLDMEKIRNLEKIVRISLQPDEKKIDTKEKVEIKNDDFENIGNISLDFGGDRSDNHQLNYYWKNNFFISELDLPKKINWRTRLLQFFLSGKHKKSENDDFWLNEKRKIYRKKLFSNLGKLAVFPVMVLLFLAINKGWEIKNKDFSKTQEAIAEILVAKNSLKDGNFEKSFIQFKNANEKLGEIAEDLDGFNGFLAKLTKYLPYLSKISSAKYLIDAGNNVSEAGFLISETIQAAEKTKSNKDGLISYLKIFQDSEKNLKKISALLKKSQDDLDNVNLNDIPEENRNEFIKAKNRLPQINSALSGFFEQEEILADILGGNGPRKYLFLFQNNQEMRATGGFIGSYGILDIFNGRIRNFFIDGIFNPDGQLKTRIVPPTPIQKISANWSLHDSNWFPDFPVSAEKAAWFYEKAGGPTVDGVIAMTPTVMQKLLTITGPIEMTEYNTTIDENNFIEKIQYEVEVDYDKELNQPKKILADLAPKILDKIFNQNNFSASAKTADVLLESLNQKHILIYSKNWEVEKMLSQNGWSGEILDTPKDYLSVINTNINGFKTDGVIEEKISHRAEIQKDGTVINTVSVLRKHNGGDSNYDWWNKVNADYLRVYVPKGSKLISAEGQTREFNSPPLDYDGLGYKRDAQIQMEEDGIFVDEESGTKVYEDAGKTVFADWVYVSPKESVEIKYTYILPFKIDSDNQKNSIFTYSILTQKQSGSLGSTFSSEIVYPKEFAINWQYPEDGILEIENLPSENKGIKIETDLKTDKFVGIAFTK